MGGQLCTTTSKDVVELNANERSESMVGRRPENSQCEFHEFNSYGCSAEAPIRQDRPSNIDVFHNCARYAVNPKVNFV